MKLLIDQNLSRRLVPDLAGIFPGTSQVQLLGFAEESDTTISIWVYARDNRYTVVTKDSDFVELSALHGQPPKVIWLNLGNVPNAVVASKLLASLDAIRAFAASVDDGVLEIE